MKDKFTEDEWNEMLYSLVMNPLEEKGSGDGGHINDHNRMAKQNRYLPFAVAFKCSKTESNLWTVFSPAGDQSVTEAQIIQYIPMLRSQFFGAVTLMSGEQYYESLSDAPVGTNVSILNAGIGLMFNVPQSDQLEAMNTKIRSVEYELNREGNIFQTIRESFNVYYFNKDASGNWTEWPSPAYPLDNLASIRFYENDKYTGKGSGFNDQMTREQLIQSIEGMDPNADSVEVWQSKDYVKSSELAALQSRVDGLEERLELLENT